MYLVIILLLFILSPNSFLATTFGINTDMECGDEKIYIENGSNGTIQTYGFPGPYPANHYCNVSLKGNEEHRVILTFVEFELYSPEGHKHDEYSSCAGLDTVTVYDGSNENAKVLGTYCGKELPPRLMSSGADLFLKLTSYISSGLKVKGYNATYSFVSNFGITSGRQMNASECCFEFDSDKDISGIITSPNPGGKYPRNTNCTYKFLGTFLQRVSLNFLHFDLEGIEPCTAKSGSDYLEFSNFINIDDPCPSRRCGIFKPQQVISEDPNFRIIFRSNERLNGFGFAAEYKFLSDRELPQWADYLKGNANSIPMKQAGLLFLQVWICLFIIRKTM